MSTTITLSDEELQLIIQALAQADVRETECAMHMDIPKFVEYQKIEFKLRKVQGLKGMADPPKQ